MTDVWDLNPATGLLTRLEAVTKIGGDLVCVCGNDPSMDGFYTCLDNGTVVEPVVDGPWQGALYVCVECGRIIDQYTLEVTGKRNPRNIIDEAAEAGGWDD